MAWLTKRGQIWTEIWGVSGQEIPTVFLARNLASNVPSATVGVAIIEAKKLTENGRKNVTTNGAGEQQGFLVGCRTTFSPSKEVEKVTEVHGHQVQGR